MICFRRCKWAFSGHFLSFILGAFSSVLYIFIYIFLLFKISIGTEIHGDKKFFRNRLPTVQVAI